MKYNIEEIKNTIICGDALEELKKFPNECIDCVITSPPYWTLRNYQVEGQIGLENTLEEYLEKLFKVFVELKRVLKKEGVLFWNHNDCYGGQNSSGNSTRAGLAKEIKRDGVFKKNFLNKCLVLQNYRLILKVLDDLRKWELREDLTKNEKKKILGEFSRINTNKIRLFKEEIPLDLLKYFKPVDPYFETGQFILRNIIVWFKPNATPASFKDRLTNKWEPVFFLVKNKKYYFNLDAIRKPYAISSIQRINYGKNKNMFEKTGQKIYGGYTLQNFLKWAEKIKTSISSFQEEREKLLENKDIEKIKEIQRYSGSPARRVLLNLLDGKLDEKTKEKFKNIGNYLKQKLKESGLNTKKLAEITGLKETTISHYFRIDFSGQTLPDKNTWNILKPILNLENYEDFIDEEIRSILPNSHPLGANPGDVWEISNAPLPKEIRGIHFAHFPDKLIERLILCGCPESGIVLDPFMGSGTVARVAQKLNRNFVGIEINKEYIEAAYKSLNLSLF